MPKTQYNIESYWQQFYKSTICEHYQWYCNSIDVVKYISENYLMENVTNIIQLGCGTSNLAVQIIKSAKKASQEAGDQIKATCIDFSKQLIKKQRVSSARGNYSHHLSYIHGDIRQLSTVKGLQKQSIDLIIDKGTIDCLFCSDNFIKVVIKTMSQCYSLLKQEGKMIIISHTSPKQRRYLFRNKLAPFTKVVCHSFKKTMEPKIKSQIANDDFYYIYVCYKGAVNEASMNGSIQKDQNQNDQKQNKDQKQQKIDQKQTTKLQKNQQKKEPAKKETKKPQQKQFILDDTANNKNQNKDKQKKQNLENKEPQFILDENQQQNEEQNENNNEDKQEEEKSQKNEKIIQKKQPQFILDDNEGEQAMKNNDNKLQSNQQAQQKEDDNQVKYDDDDDFQMM